MVLDDKVFSPSQTKVSAEFELMTFEALVSDIDGLFVKGYSLPQPVKKATAGRDNQKRKVFIYSPLFKRQRLKRSRRLLMKL